MKPIYVLIILVHLSACTKKNDLPPSLPLPTPRPSVSEVELRWKKIWTSASPLEDLKLFQKDYGLYLESNSKNLEHSYLSWEGPCGESYISLVKDTRQLPEQIHEIDSKGKVISTWHSGSGEVLRFEGNRLVRKVTFFENPEGFSQTSAADAKSKPHHFELAIEPSGGGFELRVAGSAPKTTFREIKCSRDLKKETGSDYAYCVEDPESKRKYVFQRPCT